MDSEFQKVLDEIRKRIGKDKDIEDIKGEIIENLIIVYQKSPSLFIYHLEKGGFDIGNFKINPSLQVIVSDFLSQCNGLNIDELYKIFSKLHQQNQGLIILKEIKKTLEKTKNKQSKLFIWIGNDEIGIVNKKWAFNPSLRLPPGRIIALNGEPGIQAKILGPGLHFGYSSLFVKIKT
ncbi:MAG: hypothetical protein F6K48_22295 [Okeania sp. SIO3H1]|nr:hypothetical protein [Okeania sp. SIO3H1]